RAQSRLDKLERLYHVGQNNIWDGREVLDALIKKHGPPKLPADKKESALKVLSILLWGELAAWAISADLAERIDDVEAKMAATSQVHDEARHFYVLRDYLRALGEPVPRLGGLGRRLLVKILETDSLVHKLIGMELLMHDDFRNLGMEPRMMASRTIGLQDDIVKEMLGGDTGGERRRDSVRGLLNPSRGLGPMVLEFLHPAGGRENAPGWQRAALK